MKLSEQERKRLLDESTYCSICDKDFTGEDKKVIDHNHFTGEVRGVACKSCNLHFHVLK